MRRLLLLTLPAALLLTLACSDQNVPIDAFHGDDPLGEHAELARVDDDRCKACHGEDYDGGSSGVSCFDCHDSGPPFTLHPADWDVVIVDHQAFADDHHWTLCATEFCHGVKLEGGGTPDLPGPACLNSCHNQENPPVTHAVPYVDPEAHGAPARDGQAYCLNCHGDLPNLFTGGYVADPEIVDNFLGDCILCHPDAEAHPTQWSGETNPPPAYEANHREADPAAWGPGCALCHDLTSGGGGPMPGAPGCFSSGFTNADGITSGCHENGPGMHPLGQLWMDKAEPGYHGNSSLDCALCHTVDVFCWECHFGEDGSKVPPDDDSPHGDEEAHQLLERHRTTCNNCHATNRLYGHAPASEGCHDCHDDD